jgi:drug/metabolite transporter (DMT)-like permease
MSFRSIVAPTKISAQRATAEVLLCVFFWGASFASMKIAVGEVSPFLAVWLRIVFGMSVIIPTAVLRGELRKPFRDEVIPLLFLAFLGIAFHQNIQFAGMRDAGVANSNWMIAGTPAIVAFLGWIFLKEKPNMLAIIGLVTSGIGVLFVLGRGTEGMGIFSPKGTGDLMIAISALNWAVFHILSRQLLRDHSPAFAILWMNIFASIMQSLLVFLISPQNFSGLLHVTVGGWCAILFLGCVCSGFCYVLWYDGLSALPAARMSAFHFLQPVIGVLAAYFFMGERFTLFIYIGGAMILAGVWMVNNGKN